MDGGKVGSLFGNNLGAMICVGRAYDHISGAEPKNLVFGGKLDNAFCDYVCLKTVFNLAFEYISIAEVPVRIP